jgi:hypothetical protein
VIPLYFVKLTTLPWGQCTSFPKYKTTALFPDMNKIGPPALGFVIVLQEQEKAGQWVFNKALPIVQFDTPMNS